MVDQNPAKMERCLKIRGGMVAVAGINAWTRMNTIPKKTPSVNRAMTRRSFHCDQGVSQRKAHGAGTGRTYGVCQAAPFEGQENGYDGGDESDGAGGVQLR